MIRIIKAAIRLIKWLLRLNILKKLIHLILWLLRRWRRSLR
jgi:hypothetical protein